MLFKKIKFVLVLLPVFLSGIFAQEISNEKVMLIDLAHNPVFWNDPSDMQNADHYQLERARYLADELHETTSALGVKTGYIKGEITQENLANGDLLFIHIPKSKYTRVEIQSIQNFLENGGSLFLVMDVDYWSSLDETNVNEIIKAYDIQFEGQSPDSLSGGYTLEESITKNVLKISYHGGRIIKGGTPFCFNRQTNSFPFGVYKKLRNGGKLIVMGDGMVSLYMTRWGEEVDYQCQEFMKAILNWLLK